MVDKEYTGEESRGNGGGTAGSEKVTEKNSVKRRAWRKGVMTKFSLN